MKKLLLIVGSAVLLSASTISMAQVKIAVFNLHEVLKNDPQIGIEQEKIKTQMLPQGKEIVSAKKTLQEDVKTLNGLSGNDKNNNKDKKVQQLTEKIKKERRDLINSQVDFQRKLLMAQQTSLQVILDRVKSAVSGIAKVQGFNLVLTKRNVAYNDAEIDITKQVVASIQKKNNNKKS